MVNPKHDTTVAVNCALEGGAAASATARVLNHADFNAGNDFETPDRIVPGRHRVEAGGGGLRFEVPPLSIVTAVVRLA